MKKTLLILTLLASCINAFAQTDKRRVVKCYFTGMKFDKQWKELEKLLNK